MNFISIFFQVFIVLGMYNFAGVLRPRPPLPSRQSGSQQPDVTVVLRTSVRLSVRLSISSSAVGLYGLSHDYYDLGYYALKNQFQMSHSAHALNCGRTDSRVKLSSKWSQWLGGGGGGDGGDSGGSGLAYISRSQKTSSNGVSSASSASASAFVALLLFKANFWPR